MRTVSYSASPYGSIKRFANTSRNFNRYYICTRSTLFDFKMFRDMDQSFIAAYGYRKVRYMSSEVVA